MFGGTYIIAWMGATECTGIEETCKLVMDGLIVSVKKGRGVSPPDSLIKIKKSRRLPNGR
jgi:hypothetical protein